MVQAARSRSARPGAANDIPFQTAQNTGARRITALRGELSEKQKATRRHMVQAARSRSARPGAANDIPFQTAQNTGARRITALRGELRSEEHTSELQSR